MAAKNANELKVLSGWLLALGILFVLFGFVMMVFPVAGTFSLEVLMGLLLLVLGIVEVALSFTARKWGGFLFTFVGGALSAILGLVLLVYPVGAVLALTMLLGAYLLVQGIIRIAMAFKFKPTHNWKWLLFDGAITMLLGILIITAWPLDAVWVMGLLFGISLFFSGISFLMLSSVVRE
ncbi:Uncharacterised protein [Candidatus Anstonella stagnisolia]|nr:Uncharacterised protein [Candidatus Anstonella stagnisolia]